MYRACWTERSRSLMFRNKILNLFNKLTLDVMAEKYSQRCPHCSPCAICP